MASLRRDVLVTLEYSGGVRDDVLSLKYRGDVAQVAWMARHLEGIVDRTHGELLRRTGEVLVTWCPTTRRRRRRRGYDSGELIARALARRLGARPVRLLRRLDRVPQTGAGRRARIGGPSLVARRPRSRRRRSAHDGTFVVLIVDDVVTTGASLAAARMSLRAAGVPADMILCAAVAATPSGRDR